MNSLHRGSLVCEALGDVKVISVHAVVVFRIRNRGLKKLLDQAGSISGIVFQDSQCRRNVLASDGVQYEACFLYRNPCVG